MSLFKLAVKGKAMPQLTDNLQKSFQNEIFEQKSKQGWNQLRERSNTEFPPRRSSDHWVTWHIFTCWWLLLSNVSLWKIQVLLSYVANLRHHLIPHSDAHHSIPGALMPSDTHPWPSLPFPCWDFHTSGSNTFVWWFYIPLRSAINKDMSNNDPYGHYNNIGNNDQCNRTSAFSGDLNASKKMNNLLSIIKVWQC